MIFKHLKNHKNNYRHQFYIINMNILKTSIHKRKQNKKKTQKQTKKQQHIIGYLQKRLIRSIKFQSKMTLTLTHVRKF